MDEVDVIKATAGALSRTPPTDGDERDYGFSSDEELSGSFSSGSDDDTTLGLKPPPETGKGGLASVVPLMSPQPGLWVSPLDIRFSQMKMRHLFGDGRRVADAVPLISVERCTSEEAAERGADWKMTVPFPFIEVIRWRCKLRDESTGRARIDPATGDEMFDSQERWFSFDNRRLYCMQEAALRVWPDRCVAEVAEIRSGPHMLMPGIRKFRTPDLGMGIKIGSASDGVPFIHWSWQEHAGGNADAELPHCRKGSAVSKINVLEHLTSLQEGDYERIELSKKISWVLRRGAGAMDISMDAKGWVKVSDLLHLSFLTVINAERFYKVVEESNKQKRRYELKDCKHEGTFQVYIRAAQAVPREKGAGKGRDQRKGGPPRAVSVSWMSGAVEGGTSTAETFRSNGKGKAKRKGYEREGKACISTAQSEMLPMELCPNPKQSADLACGYGNAAHRAEASTSLLAAVTEVACPKDKVSCPDKRRGVEKQDGTRRGGPLVAKTNNAASKETSRLATSAEFQNQTVAVPDIQAIRHMHSIHMHAMHRMQVFCQMRAMHQIHQMHAMACMQVQQMQAMQEWQEWQDMQGIQAESFASEECASADRIQAQIVNARNAAWGATDIQDKISDARIAARGAAGCSSQERTSAFQSSVTDTDLIVRMAEAREAARKRNINEVKHPRAMGIVSVDAERKLSTDIQARIAKAMQGARERSSGM